MTRKKLIYAVDFDGTLAKYTNWQGIGHVGEPIEPMVTRVKQLLAEGHFVSIFTARLAFHAKDSFEYKHTIEILSEWCRMHLGMPIQPYDPENSPQLQITCTKYGHFHEFWDDRARHIIPNTGIDATDAYRNLAYEFYFALTREGLDPILIKKQLEELDQLCGYVEKE